MHTRGPRRGALGPRRANLLVLVVLLLCGAALPACAGPKKLIEMGWDEPDPAFMRAHIAEMEASPFDGCVYHLLYARPDSTTGNFTWEAWGRRAFTEDELRPGLEDLRATRFRRFRHNFLRFNGTPADLDWFDDYGAVLANARLAASIAQRGGSAGILFDPEPYKGNLFDYEKLRDASTRSWDEYAAQVRRRGREVMEAFQEGYPDLTVFLLFGYSTPWSQSESGKQPLAKGPYGLLAPFLDGMVEATRGKTRLVDGYELSYGVRDTARFTTAYHLMKRDVLPIVADSSRYAAVFSFGFAIWMDHDWRKNGWDPIHTERNYYLPSTFEALTRKALETADEYVWIYSETPRWWSDKGPHQLPPSYRRALSSAKAAAARRK